MTQTRNSLWFLMIHRNLGLIERLLRFAIAIALLIWITGATAFGPLQAGAALAALALFWNGIFARCYLWKWLGLSTCKACPGRDCADPEAGETRA